MIDIVITFFALFFTDVFYTFYLKSVNNNETLKASGWAVVVFFVAAIAVVNYTTNHMLLIPACLGAFCGTWVGMKLRNRTK
jgi:peptidoglycan/LPS O-acetylase OafA/YrhL